MRISKILSVLMVTPQLPFPPEQGTTIRNYNILKGLAARHQLDLLAFGDAHDLESSPLHRMTRRLEIIPPPNRGMLPRAVDTFFSPLPDMAQRLGSPALTAKLKEMVGTERYDLIQIEGIEMARHWQLALASLSASSDRPPPVVFDDHNAEFILQKSAFESDRHSVKRMHAALYSYIQWHKLARFEREFCMAVNRVVAVSQKDAEALKALDTGVRPVVIPNGVDVEYYNPGNSTARKSEIDTSMVFTGKMDFRPNVDAAQWFAGEVLPIVHREFPNSHVSFVGQKPTAQVNELASRTGVQVTGWVPDVRPCIAEAAVYVVPLRMGGGTRLKVLEAMAMGKAIVSTTIGAEGINCVAGRDLVIADEPSTFARAVAELFQDAARRMELGANARRLALEQYDWRKIVGKFENLYESLTPSH